MALNSHRRKVNQEMHWINNNPRDLSPDSTMDFDASWMEPALPISFIQAAQHPNPGKIDNLWKNTGRTKSASLYTEAIKQSTAYSLLLLILLITLKSYNSFLIMEIRTIHNSFF